MYMWMGYVRNGEVYAFIICTLECVRSSSAHSVVILEVNYLMNLLHGRIAVWLVMFLGIMLKSWTAV